MMGLGHGLGNVMQQLGHGNGMGGKSVDMGCILGVQGMSSGRSEMGHLTGNDKQTDGGNFQSKYGQGTIAGYQLCMQQGGNDAGYEMYTPTAYWESHMSTHGGQQAEGNHQEGSKYGTTRLQCEYMGSDQATYRPTGG